MNIAGANTQPVSAREPRGGTEQALRRLLHSQSAFAMSDVMCLAVPKARPAELASIYEWYAARTTSAIRTSYAAATAAVVALLAYVDDGRPQWWPIAAFALVIALAVVVCAFQQAELAQLPRERAVAMHLLTIFERCATVTPPLIKAPIPQPDGPQPSSTAKRVVMSVVALVAITCLTVLVVAALSDEDLRLVDVGVVLAALVVVVLASRLASEFRPSSLPSDAEDCLAAIGGVRLDDYVSDPAITERVNKCLETMLASLNDIPQTDDVAGEVRCPGPATATSDDSS